MSSYVVCKMFIDDYLGEEVLEKGISVVMPAYNCEKYIEAAVESVLDQTFSDIELIVVDDCSTDHTFDILSDIASRDDRIRLLRNENNMGVARTRNNGIQHAGKECTALLDSDDIWEKNKLALQYELYQQGNRIVYCSYDFIDDEGRTIKKPFIVPTKTDFKKMLTSNVISCSTVLVQTQLLMDNPFSSQYYHEDYVLWMQLIKSEKSAVGSKEILTHYRLHENSRSSKKTNAALQRWKVYRDELKLGFFQSVFAFVGYAVKGVIKYYLN